MLLVGCSGKSAGAGWYLTAIEGLWSEKALEDSFTSDKVTASCGPSSLLLGLPEDWIAETLIRFLRTGSQGYRSPHGSRYSESCPRLACQLYIYL